jgi:PEP-CTERM motif
MNFQKKLLAVALSTVGALAVPAVSQAGVLGQSVLEITNFQFLNSPGGSIVNVTQFSQLAFNDSSNATANLNGVIASQAVNQNTFGTLDLPQQCVGQCVFGQNDFSHRTGPSTLNVARADTLLRGSPLGGTSVSSPADAHVVNEGQLTTIGGFGAIQANLGLTASFAFKLGASQSVTISFDSLSHLIAEIGLGDNGTARASEQFTIDIRDGSGAQVFAWSPNGQPGGITGGVEVADTCDLQRAVNAQLPGQTSLYDCNGTHVATTGILTAGTFYTLGLRHAGDVDVTRTVPEPSGVMLVGLALAGLGYAARRKQGAKG